MLIHSYLERHKQCVSTNAYVSSSQLLKFGVPQESILGPLLCNVFINDIVDICNLSGFIIYADETSVFMSASKIDELVTKENLVKKKYFVVNNNGLKNTVNFKAIVFKPLNKHVTGNYDLKIGTNQIEIVKQQKMRGVMF